MTDKIYIICEQDVWMNDDDEEFCTSQNLLQGFETLNKAKETLEKWAEKRNAKICSCARKSGYSGYVKKHDDKVSTYRWIDVVSIAN